VGQEQTAPNVLIIYYSLSGQSRGLVNLFKAGLKDEGVSVAVEQLRACEKISFPFKNIVPTLKMMIITFFRFRIQIKPLNSWCFKSYDLIVISGPTWSYNPSGPVLSLFDRDGGTLMAGQRVLPLISCRGYYRLHNYFLRKKLISLGADLEDSLIFTHPVSEPWSTIGVFLKSAGYRPEIINFFRNYYPHFGHTTAQLKQARTYGRETGRNLIIEKNKES
jgi:hypothetical protein